MDVNAAAVSGAIVAGGGNNLLEDVLSSMNIPSLSAKTFRKYENVLGHQWENIALEKMKEAAGIEKRIAVERGNVDLDGMPFITVVVDGTWCKRSYRTNYNSLSGTAEIVGYQSGNVLFLGVKNRYCTTCARADSKNTSPKEHDCSKNWDGTATSMESAIILEGFRCSEKMYGLRYKNVIGDGDSSVYSKIIAGKPYKNCTVRKIECRNHLLRNMCFKLRNIVEKGERQHKTLRNIVSANILRLRTAIVKALKYRKSQINLFGRERCRDALRSDVLNSVDHIFGDHSKCADYFCNRSIKEGCHNVIDKLKSSGLYGKLVEPVRIVSCHCASLLEDADNNRVEQFNSIIAKFIGGKRVNFSLRKSYQNRCFASVVKFNTGMSYYDIHKKHYQASPGKFCKTVEERRKRRAKRALQVTSKRRKTLFPVNKSNRDYGENSQQEDICDEEMEFQKAIFVKNLELTDEQKKELQDLTVMQADNELWLNTRRYLLTSSNFGPVCTRRPHTSCSSLVKNILYSNFTNSAISYGRKNEKIALSALGSSIGKTITPCGLFIHPLIPFLGATPDVLVEEDGVVEVKCPESAASLSPLEAVKIKKLTYLKLEGDQIKLKKSHRYYYQIQGQLSITGRTYCLFAVWTPKGIFVEKILRDEQLWGKMEQKLREFYIDCILPELLNPRYNRNLKIRDPPRVMKMHKTNKELKKNAREINIQELAM